MKRAGLLAVARGHADAIEAVPQNIVHQCLRGDAQCRTLQRGKCREAGTGRRAAARRAPHLVRHAVLHRRHKVGGAVEDEEDRSSQRRRCGRD